MVRDGRCVDFFYSQNEKKTVASRAYVGNVLFQRR